MVLMWWPLAASAQMVSPGGGNYTGAILGGQCTNPEFVQGISSTGYVTCALPVGGGGGGGAIAGDVPQIVGFSATNVPAAVTSTGDVTFAPGAAGTYVATVSGINGVPPGPLATATVGNGLTLIGGALGLTVPVSVANGGTGYTGTATSPQILIAQTTGAFHPELMSGDVTITAAGVATVHSIGGAAGPFMTTSSPTYTGTMTGGSINLSGSLTFNGTAVGGTCSTGQLMNGLSATLVPACVAIQGGNGIIINNGVISLAAPVTVANGGLGQGSFPPTAGQVLIALNPTNYIPRTISGDLTIGTTGTATVTQVNGVVPGGACTAGSYVVSLNSSAVPTCSANLGTIYAPLVNPAGGANNYAPLSGATFTGTTTVNNLTAPSTATWTFPDGSTYTSAGHNNMKALGIGMPASTTAGQLIDATYNGNGNATFILSNNSTGANASSVIYLANSADSGWILQAGTGFTAGGSAAPPDALQIASNGANGISLATNPNFTPPPTIGFWSGNYKVATMYGGQPAGNAGIMIPASGALAWSSYSQPSAWINSGFTASFNVAAGGHVNNAGTAWVADNTSASILSANGNALSVFNNSGLTVGNTFGPVPTATFYNTGTGGAATALVFPQTNYSQLQFGSYNTTPTASIMGYSNSGALHLAAGSFWNGGSWVQSNYNAEEIDIDQSTPYGVINMNVMAYGGAIGGAFNWNTIGRFEFASLTSGPVQGLDLSGYANRVGTGQAVASLTVGNSYFSGINWANVSISGASYPINNANGWQADCGAGSGVALFQVGPGNGLHMYNYGGLGCNAGFAWTNIANWSFGGMTVRHIENLDEEAPSTRDGKPTQSKVPAVTSGALVRGSRDMFGWITNVKGGQTTLTFRQPFDGESNCTLTDAGQPNLWFEAGQTTGQVTFACVVPWTGEPCPDGAWVEYHCFGQGG